MSRRLPERANLEFLTKEAKARLRTAGADAKLSDCQHELAREYGFASWPKLKAHVELLAATDPSEAFGAALKTRSVAAVEEVLDRFPSLVKKINEPVSGGSFGATALIVAVQQGNREMVDLLLKHGANINQRSHWWAGGFHVLESDHGLADFLINRGAILDAKSAAGLGRIDDLRVLLAANPDSVHLRSGDGQTPLHVARSVEVAELLLRHGAQIDARDVDHESTPAQYLIQSHPEVSRYLVERGALADIMLLSALGDEPRVSALLESNPDVVTWIISDKHFPMRNHHAGGHIYNWTLGKGKTPHAVAHLAGHHKSVALLLEKSPPALKLVVACEIGDDVLLRQVLSANPGLVRKLGDDEKRRLPQAAQDSDIAAVRRMLQSGWPVGATGQHGATALHWAGFHGNAELARLILEFTPPLEAKEQDFGQTPLQWTAYGSINGWHAERGNYAETAELLLKAGAKIHGPVTSVKATEPVMAVMRRYAPG